jgi:uncharacterized membrane protein YjjB (DUF3815 family)
MIAVAVSGFVINWALACQATSPSQVIQVVPAFAIGLLGNLYTKFTQKMSFDAVLLGVNSHLYNKNQVLLTLYAHCFLSV